MQTGILKGLVVLCFPPFFHGLMNYIIFIRSLNMFIDIKYLNDDNVCALSEQQFGYNL